MAVTEGTAKTNGIYAAIKPLKRGTDSAYFWPKRIITKGFEIIIQNTIPPLITNETNRALSKYCFSLSLSEKDENLGARTDEKLDEITVIKEESLEGIEYKPVMAAPDIAASI